MVRGERPVFRPIVGLDLSLTATGICLLDVEGEPSFSVVGHGLKRTAKQRDKIERIVDIVSAIVDVVSDCSSKPRVAIEGYAFGARGAQNDLGELHGAVKLQLWLGHGIEPVIIPSSRARKIVLGKGRLPKNEIVEMLTNRGINVKDHNEADAFVVASCLEMTLEKETR